MQTYRVCDLVLESNVALDELPRAAGRAPQMTFRYDGGRPRLALEPRQTLRSQTRNGGLWMDISEIEGGHLVRFPQQAEFRVAADGGSITGFKLADTPLHTVRQLLLEQVLPLVLSNRSELVLHAGAVETEHGAAAFVGTSGSGKSTLIASLAAAGHTLISDHFLVLRPQGQDWLAHPSYPGLRLWEDSARALFQKSDDRSPAVDETAKCRCDIPGNRLPFAIEPSPLERVYVLAPPTSERIVITPLTTRQAFAAMVQHCYRLEADDRAFLGRHFGALGKLSERPIFRRLAFPHVYAKLAETRQALRKELERRSIHA